MIHRLSLTERVRAAACILLATCTPTLAGEVHCYDNADYHVVARANDDDPGEKVLVTVSKGRPPPRACTYDRKAADYLLFGKDGEPNYAKQLVGRYLVVEASTGPQSNLLLFDLAAKRKVLDVPANDYKADDQTLVYWERVRDATVKDCPAEFRKAKRDQLGIMVSMERSFDVATGKVEKRSGKRCEVVQ